MMNTLYKYLLNPLLSDRRPANNHTDPPPKTLRRSSSNHSIAIQSCSDSSETLLAENARTTNSHRRIRYNSPDRGRARQRAPLPKYPKSAAELNLPSSKPRFIPGQEPKPKLRLPSRDRIGLSRAHLPVDSVYDYGERWFAYQQQRVAEKERRIRACGWSGLKSQLPAQGAGNNLDLTSQEIRSRSFCSVGAPQTDVKIVPDQIDEKSNVRMKNEELWESCKAMPIRERQMVYGKRLHKTPREGILYKYTPSKWAPPHFKPNPAATKPVPDNLQNEGEISEQECSECEPESGENTDTKDLYKNPYSSDEEDDDPKEEKEGTDSDHHNSLSMPHLYRCDSLEFNRRRLLRAALTTEKEEARILPVAAPTHLRELNTLCSVPIVGEQSLLLLKKRSKLSSTI